MRTSQPAPSAARKPTNVSLPRDLVTEAKRLGVNLSKACERGLAAEVAETRSAQWRRDNQEAIEAWNAHVEANGLPLARFRQF